MGFNNRSTLLLFHLLISLFYTISNPLTRGRLILPLIFLKSRDSYDCIYHLWSANGFPFLSFGHSFYPCTFIHSCAGIGWTPRTGKCCPALKEEDGYELEEI